jgi:type VI secretion system secreted protein Hcp
MAEMFLKLEKIDGESIDQDHKDWIEIKSWSWNTTNTVKWHLNQGGQSTQVKVNGIKVDKICDKASVTLYQNCVTGKHIPSGQIVCRKNDGENKVEYMILELKDIMISDVTFTGNSGDQSIDEAITLEFAEFNLKYKVQGDSGNPAGYKGFSFHIQTQEQHSDGG